MPGQTLAQAVRAKYPGTYDDLDDAQLEAAIDAKHPGAYADVPRTNAGEYGAQPTEEEWAAKPIGERARTVLQVVGRGLAGAFMGPAGVEAADHPGATLASAAIPGVLSVAASRGGPAIQAAANTAARVISKPSVGGTIGAVEGWRQNGITGAALGAAAGAGGSTTTGRYLKRLGLNKPTPKVRPPSPDAVASERMVQGMGQAGSAPRPPAAAATAPAPPGILAFRGAKATNADWNDPAYFTTDIDEANAYSSAANPAAKLFGDKAKPANVKPGAQVQPVKLDVKNPKQVSFAEAANATPETLQKAAAEGFDAITYTDGKKTWYVPVNAKAQAAPAFGAPKGSIQPTWSMSEAAPSHQATPRQSLEQEILARISAEPDWRTVDAVPINAMQSKGILQPGESRVGLAEGAAAAAKSGNQAEVEALLKALRQRMNISAKR